MMDEEILVSSNKWVENKMGSGRLLGLAWHLHRSGSSLSSFLSVLISICFFFRPSYPLMSTFLTPFFSSSSSISFDLDQLSPPFPSLTFFSPLFSSLSSLFIPLYPYHFLYSSYVVGVSYMVLSSNSIL
ncbi:hypothetical protein BJX99DRAFT_101993 [Aspergillus californicus]